MYRPVMDLVCMPFRKMMVPKCVAYIPVPILIIIIGYSVLFSYWDKFETCDKPLNTFLAVEMMFLFLGGMINGGWCHCRPELWCLRAFTNAAEAIVNTMFLVWNLIGLFWLYQAHRCLDKAGYAVFLAWFVLFGLGSLVYMWIFAGNVLWPVCKRCLPAALLRCLFCRRGTFAPVSTSDTMEFAQRNPSNVAEGDRKAEGSLYDPSSSDAASVSTSRSVSASGSASQSGSKSDSEAELGPIRLHLGPFSDV